MPSYLFVLEFNADLDGGRHRHITHEHRCILGASLTVIALCCDLRIYCLHTHTEEQKCIYNLLSVGLSVCVRALDHLGLLNGNDPVGHHGMVLHTRQQMAAGIPSSP